MDDNALDIALHAFRGEDWVVERRAEVAL